MASEAFIDTNVFVYSVDSADPSKQARAQQTLREVARIVVSTQVMNEFYVISTRNLEVPLTAEEATAVVEQMANYTCVAVDSALVLRAIKAGRQWQLSHCALMVEAARQAGCSVLLSEDLADGANYDGLRVENPFAAQVDLTAPEDAGTTGRE